MARLPERPGEMTEYGIRIVSGKPPPSRLAADLVTRGGPCFENGQNRESREVMLRLPGSRSTRSVSALRYR